jgi:hypothetical protein
MAQQRKLWQGQNGWEIALAAVPDKDMQCVLLRETSSADHQLSWIWDDYYGLFLMFMDKNFEAMNDHNYNESNSTGRERFIVSVDGDVLEDRGEIRTILDLPSVGPVAFSSPRLLALDHNNPGEWTRPTTEQVFTKLRKGRTLKIDTYGVTYTDDLTGVGSALDLFPRCIMEKNRVLDELQPGRR